MRVALAQAAPEPENIEANLRMHRQAAREAVAAFPGLPPPDRGRTG